VLGVKLVFLVGAPLVLVLRSLWVKLEAPSGIQLTRRNAPELHRILAELRRALKTPRLHRVLLMPDFNAAVTQVPRFGIFGWHRNFLLLGLPLMKALTVEQFQAVLGHELGHLSRGHARAANWIYRLRRIWACLADAFAESEGWGAVLIRPFVTRYIPYFAASSFPLARADEYEADNAAVRLTSARSAAQALTASEIVGTFWSERYWARIHSAAKDMPQPAFAPYREFGVDALRDLSAEDPGCWLDAALRRTTSYADTHPCLADRLAAIGAPAEFSPPAPADSAEQLLGPLRTRWEQEFDESWRQHVAEPWKTVHERHQSGRARINELRTKAMQSPLDELNGLELAELEEALGEGKEKALSLRRALVERYPESLPARFVLAKQLLESGDAEGVEPMESVVSADSETLLAGAQLLRDFFWSRRDAPRAHLWHQKYLERANLLQAAQKEREQLLPSDQLVPHQLPAEELERLVAQIRIVGGVRRAYLARKLTFQFPERPMYVLGFTTPWRRLDGGATPRVLVHQICDEVSLPGDALILHIGWHNDRLAKKIRKVRMARVL
jgi:Zn-dependent protease with chaperone function